MIDWKQRADELLQEYNMCCRAKPKHRAIEVQLEKDSVGRWASHLSTQRSWGSDVEIAEACNQLEPRLKELKEKLIFEVLKNGTV